jgi:hypothetical protein
MTSYAGIVVDNITIKINTLYLISIKILGFILYQSAMIFKLIRNVFINTQNLI